jgi:hypothetical protein
VKTEKFLQSKKNATAEDITQIHTRVAMDLSIMEQLRNLTVVVALEMHTTPGRKYAVAMET